MKYFNTTPQLSKISKKSQIFLIQAQQTWYFVKFIINKKGFEQPVIYTSDVTEPFPHRLLIPILCRSKKIN
jgi:hypothetical protein